MDPLRQFPERDERGARGALRLADQLRGPARVPAGDGAGEPQPHGESDEVLLGAVVDVALDARAGDVGRRDDPLPRRP